jgi:hypothetical protein
MIRPRLESSTSRMKVFNITSKPTCWVALNDILLHPAVVIVFVILCVCACRPLADLCDFSDNYNFRCLEYSDSLNHHETVRRESFMDITLQNESVQNTRFL